MYRNDVDTDDNREEEKEEEEEEDRDNPLFFLFRAITRIVSLCGQAGMIPFDSGPLSAMKTHSPFAKL